MPINVKACNPYKTVIDIVVQDIEKHNKPYGTILVWLWTSVLGYTTTILSYDCNEGEWCWETDWYEAGDIKLIGYILVEDIDFEKTRGVVMFGDDVDENRLE